MRRIAGPGGDSNNCPLSVVLPFGLPASSGVLCSLAGICVFIHYRYGNRLTNASTPFYSHNPVQASFFHGGVGSFTEILLCFTGLLRLMSAVNHVSRAGAPRPGQIPQRETQTASPAALLPVRPAKCAAGASKPHRALFDCHPQRSVIRAG